MVGDRFRRIRATLAASPRTSWQRWTIDEIDEDVVRVLVSEGRAQDDLRLLTAEVLRLAEAPSTQAALRTLLRGEAMRIELLPPREAWTAEIAAFAPRGSLEEFLRTRHGKPGLPDTRPLREGDTFWVFLPDGITGLDVLRRVPTLPLESYTELRADVWDVTAAARQAAKLTYQHAVRSAGDSAERGRDRG